METLDPRYKQVADAIKEAIQGSEILEAYLNDEEESYFQQMQEYFEPAMQELFNDVANENPIQLEMLEQEFLDPAFEGLFLPKILGYSVLRGEVDQNLKYRRPQNHFKDILAAICNSANFELIKKRIGQTVTLGFALSSDIWITNFMESLSNKKVKLYLNSLRQDKYRDVINRKALYDSYHKQLEHVNYASTKFPDNAVDIKNSFHSLKSFLTFRASGDVDNSVLIKEVNQFVNNKELQNTDEYFELFQIIGLMYDLDDNLTKEYKAIFKGFVKNTPNLEQKFFKVYESLHEDEKITVTPEHEQKLSKLVSDAGNEEIKRFFDVANTMHSKGFIHVDAIDTISKYYEKHKGMSIQNECLRASVLSYIVKFINNLDPENFTDYMDINKTVIVYIGIFNNEKFNQEVKDASMDYIQKCTKKFTDKKSKEYQEVRKYVTTTFVELGFLSSKEVIELFKTRRKVTSVVAKKK